MRVARCRGIGSWKQRFLPVCGRDRDRYFQVLPNRGPTAGPKARFWHGSVAWLMNLVQCGNISPDKQQTSASLSSVGILSAIWNRCGCARATSGVGTSSRLFGISSHSVSHGVIALVVYNGVGSSRYMRRTRVITSAKHIFAQDLPIPTVFWPHTSVHLLFPFGGSVLWEVSTSCSSPCFFPVLLNWLASRSAPSIWSHVTCHVSVTCLSPVTSAVTYSAIWDEGAVFRNVTGWWNAAKTDVVQCY